MLPVDPPVADVRAAVTRALAEDLTPLGDVTSALLPPDLEADADLVARQDGVFAGRSCVDATFAAVDEGVRVQWTIDGDGALLQAGTHIARVSGPLASILTAERTALNFATHLSGIATLTRRHVDAVSERIVVWDTRKTTPGLRALEKAAVRAGGGRNHRGNLSDWVLVKDNHRDVLGVKEAVVRARERWPGRTVHVECDTAEHVREALEARADALLLDNMTPEEAAGCMELVRSERDDERPLVEASGGISLENVAAYADAGVDAVSVGALTSSAPALDIGLDLVGPL